MTMELTHQELDGGLQARAVGSPGGSRSLLSAFRLFAFLKRSKLKKEKKKEERKKRKKFIVQFHKCGIYLCILG